MDWNTFWTAVGALATTAAVVAVAFAARQLQFQAWVEAQRIFVDREFTDARGRLFQYLRVDERNWERQDQDAGMVVCRKMDEFCRLAPYFAFTEHKGQKKVLEVWDDPLGKSWALLETLVEQERKNVGWIAKWNAFENLGRSAFLRLPSDRQNELKKIAERLKPQILQLMRPRGGRDSSGAT